MTRTTRRSAVASGVAMMLGLSALAGPSQAQDIGALEPGQLQIGLDLTYAPYSYFKDDTPVGFDVETLRMIAKALEVDPVFKDTRFEQVIIGVRGKQFDLTPGLYMTPARAEAIKLVPYFSAGSAVVVRVAEENAPTTEMELCGLKVSSIKGGAVVEKVLNETNPKCEEAGKQPVDIREYPTDPEATQALLGGGVDAQLTEGIIAANAVEKTNGQLKISSEALLYPVQVGWGISLGNDALAGALSAALETITESGEYGELLKEYGLQTFDPELAKQAVIESD